jgi:hypothetical protein
MNKKIVDAEQALAVAEARMAGGMPECYAAKSAGISLGTLRRWRKRAAAGKQPRDYSGSGRPPSVEVSDADAQILREYCIRANIGKRRSSAAGGCRIAAMNPDSGLSAELRTVILKPRADPRALPRPILEAVREVCTPAVVGRYRDSRDGLSNGLYAPGYLRVRSGDISSRLAPMERVVPDDGSTNFLFWVPWDRGGDKCSDRFGARLVRGQMLAFVDAGCGFCPHYSMVVRERDSYTGGDVCASMLALWSKHGVPPEMVVEGGNWSAARATELMRRAGTHVISAKGRPHQKLVERWFGSLWTIHSSLVADGHIGRFRGESWKESKEAQAVREGRRDPRQAFPAMSDFLDGLDRAVDIANRTEIVSGTYGRWVPSERWADAQPASHRLPDGLTRLGLPVIEERVVRRGGMVTVRAANAAGMDQDFAFAVREGHLYEGARVSVAFDPRFPEQGADVRLAGQQKHGADYALVDAAAVCMCAAPQLGGAGGGFFLKWFDSRKQARTAKGAARAAVITAVRTADARGRKVGESGGVCGGVGAGVSGEDAALEAAKALVEDAWASPAVGSRESGIGNRESGVGNRKEEVGNLMDLFA